jgi:hypothetical protein
MSKQQNINNLFSVVILNEFRFSNNLKLSKMKTKNVLVLLAFVAVFASCKKEDDNGGESNTATNISTTNGNESHNMGKNCMQCHNSTGEGKGTFIVAGTLYDDGLVNTYGNGTVKLYSGINATGNLVATVQVDAKGNFFTTSSINFGTGLYPTVVGASGKIEHMGKKITSGACNSCHGVTEDKVWVAK